MSLSFGLPSKSFQEIVALLSTNKKISEAYIFGSRTKGNFREGSDIDVALKGLALTRNDILDLQLSYEELNFPWKLDLLVYSQISDSNLKEHIDRMGVKIL